MTQATVVVKNIMSTGVRNIEMGHKIITAIEAMITKLSSVTDLSGTNVQTDLEEVKRLFSEGAEVAMKAITYVQGLPAVMGGDKPLTAVEQNAVASLVSRLPMDEPIFVRANTSTDSQTARTSSTQPSPVDEQFHMPMAEPDVRDFMPTYTQAEPTVEPGSEAETEPLETDEEMHTRIAPPLPFEPWPEITDIERNPDFYDWDYDRGGADTVDMQTLVHRDMVLPSVLKYVGAHRARSMLRDMDRRLDMDMHHGVESESRMLTYRLFNMNNAWFIYSVYANTIKNIDEDEVEVLTQAGTMVMERNTNKTLWLVRLMYADLLQEHASEIESMHPWSQVLGLADLLITTILLAYRDHDSMSAILSRCCWVTQLAVMTNGAKLKYMDILVHAVTGKPMWELRSMLTDEEFMETR